MALHARQVAIAAGARADEVDRVAGAMIARGQIRGDLAAALLAEMRQHMNEG
jgi:hydroxymethylglutaryl-CoA reductase